MTAMPRIYGTLVTGLGSIDKSATVATLLFPDPGPDVTLRWRRYTHSSRETS